MKSRDRFEKWFNSYFEGHCNTEKSQNGDYVCQQAYNMWNAYKQGNTSDGKEEIFSGNNSHELWDDIDKLNNKSTGGDIQDVIYHICCKIQELESKIGKEEI